MALLLMRPIYFYISVLERRLENLGYLGDQWRSKQLYATRGATLSNISKEVKSTKRQGMLEIVLDVGGVGWDRNRNERSKKGERERAENG